MPAIPAASPFGPHTQHHRARRAVIRSWRELKVPLAPGQTFALAPLRQLAVCALISWDIGPGQIDDILLVLSELATNALIHTDDAVQIRLRRANGTVELEVADTSPHLPDFDAGPEGNAAHHGYGLKLIVTALAKTVTVTKHPRCGKTITVTFGIRTGTDVTSPDTRP